MRKTIGAAAALGLAVAVAYGVGGAPVQETRLVPADSAEDDAFGYTIGLSGDTTVVGAIGSGEGRGSASVFVRGTGAWDRQATLAPDDAADNDQFGGAAAVDGDTVIVGAEGKSSGLGAAYVFHRAAGVWTQQAKLVASDGVAGDRFGADVTVRGDTAVVGTFLKNGQTGAAYVFRRTGSVWAEEAKLTASDAVAGDHFGYSVALEGDTVIVGAISRQNGRGAAYVYVRSGVAWTEETTLVAANGTFADHFGGDVALSGATALVSAPDDSSERGSVYAYTRSGTTWTQQQQFSGSGLGQRDLFGYAMALEGDTAVIGAVRTGEDRGLVFVFERAGGTWTEAARVASDDLADSDRLGVSVGLSGDTFVAGADGKDASRGAAYVFDLTPPGPQSGFVLATKVKAKVVAADAARSSLTVTGTLDTGTAAPDFSGAATFDAGGFHLVVPQFVRQGKAFTFSAGGMDLKITPSKTGSSRAAFTFEAEGDLAGKVDLDGPLAFRFTNAAHDARGTVRLASGDLAEHGLVSPSLAVAKAAAKLKGAGKDSLKLTLPFATDGVVPATAGSLAVCFGPTFTSTAVAGPLFVRKNDAYVFTGFGAGITKATVDYAKGTITIVAGVLDLGAFAEGGNPVAVTVFLGGLERSIAVRMVRKAKKLSY